MNIGWVITRNSGGIGWSLVHDGVISHKGTEDDEDSAEVVCGSSHGDNGGSRNRSRADGTRNIEFSRGLLWFGRGARRRLLVTMDRK